MNFRPFLNLIIFTISIFISVNLFAAMGSVSSEYANVRSGPGTNHALLRTYNQYTPLKIIETQGAWHKISDYKGRKGWIYKNLLSNTPALVVKAEKANVRSAPSLDSEVLWTFNEGISLQCLTSEDSWYKIKYDDKVAWISNSLVWGFCTTRIYSANKDLAYVHETPNTKSKITFKVILYAPLEVISIKGDWYYVKDFEGDKGWIYKKYLSTVPSVVIKNKEAKIMGGPGEKFEVKWVAHKGVPLRCLRESDGWFKIVDNDDDIGWVKKSEVWGNCY